MDDGYDDDFAMAWVQYIRATGRFRVFQGYRNKHLITDFYGTILTGIPESRFGHNYGKEERRIMRRQLELPPMIYVADAHIDNVEQITGTSPMEHLASHYGISTFTDFQQRTHKERRIALGNLLPMMDFHGFDGAPDVLEAVQRYRMKETKDGKDQMQEYKVPLHDKWSHFVTALEYFATNWATLRLVGNAGAKPKYTGQPHV
jgi:hypothetical protein